MKRTALPAVASLIAAAVLGPARAAEPVHEYEFRMPAGQSEQICVPLKKGQGFEFSFQTDAPVEFTVQRKHGAKLQTTFDLRNVMRQTNRIVAKAAGDYCMTWTASRLGDAGVLGSWQRLVQP